MKLTARQILKNTNDEELYTLLKPFVSELVKVTKDTGIFCVEDGHKIFNARDIRKAIKETKRIWY